MKMEQQKISVRSSVGFSLPELMVVVVIIGILASLGLPRLRAFIAKTRQAEAKTNLSHIHTLQVTYQSSEDTFASWAKGSSQVGKDGTCTIAPSSAGACSQKVSGTGTCTSTDKATCIGNTACKWTGGDGAYELGFKPPNCGDLRYGYWILSAIETDTGKESFLAIAYAPSDMEDRIYPTCTGKKSGRAAVEHAKKSKTGLGALTTGAPPDGDWQTVSEDKVFGISDIIPVCEE